MQRLSNHQTNYGKEKFSGERRPRDNVHGAA